MNRIFTLLFLSVFAVALTAQTPVEVTIGNVYANEVYYSFSNGSLVTSPRTNWDMAFAIDRMNINILANNGSGVKVYTYPNGNTTAWDDIDTTGMYTWTPMYNSVEDLNNGAFVRNMNLDDAFDQGWGVYNMATHIIEGDSLFVMKNVAGEYKKMWIVSRDPNSGINNWVIKYADIDGGNEETFTFSADDYPGLNFAHYSMETNSIVEKEPASANWQLLFTKYFDYSIPYYVTGVQINSAYVTVQQVDGVAQNDYENYTEGFFTSNLSEIGSDWKTFDMNTYMYNVDDQRVYFSKVLNEEGNDSTYWKLYFTGFSGSSTGTYSFTQKDITDYSAIYELAGLSVFELYPNPAQDQLNLITDATTTMEATVVDMTGKLVTRKTIDADFTTSTISITSLKQGVYTLILTSPKGRAAQKFVKQ